MGMGESLSRSGKNKSNSNNYSVFGRDILTKRNKLSNLAEIDQNKQIIFFEGCNPVLGCTIILSGPFNEKKDSTAEALPISEFSGFLKLLKVQWQLRKMLYMSRNVILEREFLYQLKINPQAEETPYLVTRNIKNRSTLVLYKVMIKKGLQTLKNEMSKRMNDTLNQDFSIDMTNNDNNLSRTRSKNRRTKSVFAQSNDPEKANTSPVQLNEYSTAEKEQDKKQIDENFVKTKFDQMCG